MGRTFHPSLTRVWAHTDRRRAILLCVSNASRLFDDELNVVEEGAFGARAVNKLDELS